VNTQEALERMIARSRELRHEGLNPSTAYRRLEKAMEELDEAEHFHRNDDVAVEAFTAAACLLIMMVDDPDPLLPERTLEAWLADKEKTA
jgi:hypothetical protein